MLRGMHKSFTLEIERECSFGSGKEWEWNFFVHVGYVVAIFWFLSACLYCWVRLITRDRPTRRCNRTENTSTKVAWEETVLRLTWDGHKSSNNREWELPNLNITICFIVLLGLVFMGRHKCEAVACLSSQVKCNFMNCYIVHYIYGE